MPIVPGRRLNPFIALRIASVPILWVCAVCHWIVALSLGLAAAAFTDVLDGWLARRFPEFGDGRLDSFADKLLTFSVVLWLLLLRPALFVEQAGPLLAAASLYAGVVFYSWRKFRRVSALHLYTGKFGGLVQAAFVLHTFLTDGYSPALFALAVGTFIVAAAEEVAVLAVYPVLEDDRVHSILPYIRARLGRRV